MNMDSGANTGGHSESPGGKGLDGLSDDEVKDLRQTLRHQIDHMAQRIAYTEGRLSGLTLVAAALVAAGVALLPLVLTQLENLKAVVPLAVLASSGFAIGLLMWHVYARQTNFPYPFVGVASTRKWFYHYALDVKPFDTPWYRHPRRELREAGKEAYKSQWKDFRDNRVRDLSNLHTDTLQDAEQVFLLHVNERYKNLFLTHLRDVLTWGIRVAVVLTILGLVVALAVDVAVLSDDDETAEIASGSHMSGDVVVESSWRSTGNTRSLGTAGAEVEMVLNLYVENDGGTPVTVNDVAAKDRFGMTLPISIESPMAGVAVVPAGSTAEVVGLVWIVDSVSDDLDHFEVSE